MLKPVTLLLYVTYIIVILYLIWVMVQLSSSEFVNTSIDDDNNDQLITPYVIENVENLNRFMNNRIRRHPIRSLIFHTRQLDGQNHTVRNIPNNVLDRILDMVAIQALLFETAADYQNLATKQTDEEKWTSDSQNVHDSNIMTDFETQYKFLYMLYPGCSIKNYTLFKSDILEGLDDANENTVKIKKVFDHIDNNYTYKTLRNTYDIRIICGLLWCRINDQINKSRKSDMISGARSAIESCEEENTIYDNRGASSQVVSIVCSTGIVKKIWFGMSLLDHDKALFVTKNKQIYRNEIFEKCQQMLNEYINKLEPDLLARYQNDSLTDEEKQQIKLTCKQIIINIVDNYRDKLDGLSINHIVEESLNAVI